MSVTVSIGYSLEPGWAYQWNGIQRHLARLREQYQGINTLGNVDVEQNVHSLFLGLNHLGDWLDQDSTIPPTKTMVNKWINQHPESLGICRAYANTWKHMTRDRPGALIAQITRIESGPSGQKVTIGYRPWDQPSQPMTEVDGLALAEQSEQDWRDFLKMHSISIPSLAAVLLAPGTPIARRSYGHWAGTPRIVRVGPSRSEARPDWRVANLR